MFDNNLISIKSYLFSRIPTAAVFGGIAFSALVFVSDWRVVLDYVPFINGKFKDKD